MAKNIDLDQSNSWPSLIQEAARKVGSGAVGHGDILGQDKLHHKAAGCGSLLDWCCHFQLHPHGHLWRRRGRRQLSFAQRPPGGVASAWFSGVIKITPQAMRDPELPAGLVL